MIVPTRQEAFNLLTQYITKESLINHAKSVEAVMRYVAELKGEATEKWGIIGLIHDLDYEQYPDQHCTMTKKILEENNWDTEYIRAVVSHGWGICSDVEPLTDLEKTLFAIDELTGLVTACALVRPSKSVKDLEVKSVKKKWNIKAFAEGANRDVIDKGAEMLGVNRDTLIEWTIMGMREIADEIGL